MNIKHTLFQNHLGKGLLGAGIVALSLLYAPLADAQGGGQLQSITATKLAGEHVQLELRLSGPAPQPLTFTVNQPARLALDLSNTTLDLAHRKTDISVGAVNSVVAAEAGGRTRVVVNLNTLVPYNISVRGDSVYVILGSGPNDTAVAHANPSNFGPPSVASTPAVKTPEVAPPEVAPKAPEVAVKAPAPAPAPAPAVAKAEPEKQPAAAATPVESAPAGSTAPSGNVLTAVDFHRGSDGTAQVTVDLSDPGIIGNVHNVGSNVVVDFANAQLPKNLVRRMDVTDFATPVQYIDAENTANGARLVIHPSGKFDKLAYQSDNTFSVEFKPISEQVAAQNASLGGKTFSGQKISLNFQNIDVRAVLQILADASGRNIVVSDSVRGNITLRLQDVPWDEALQIILHSKGLALRQYGNVMMIGTATEMAAQSAAESAAQEAEPLESAFIQINYAKAADIAKLLQGDKSLLSSRASVSVDTRTNTLLVQDTASNLDDIRRMIAKLDIPVKQVLIESRIVIANNDFNEALGVKFGATGARAINGNSGLIAVTGNASGANDMVGSAISNIGSSGQQFPVSLPTSLNDQLNVNTPAAGAVGQIGLAILRNNYLLNLELSAMQAEGKGEVVSSPRVITANQSKAHIEQGVQIPYQQAASSGATTVSFKNAVLSLDVTPQITPDNRIIMDLEVHKDSVGQNVSTGTGGSIPSIDTRDVQTQVLVNNGDTVVLGGIYETTKNTTVSKVPLLGDIPLLGWLFRNTITTNNKDELLIFVTPKIVADQNGSAGVGE
ncbi:MAG TPA: type IV pilus secretin PilQ [Gammaproteobacteria bacterium]|nr:type IV pilus secretin PilQ [Gammaproteobacteria bacterium]